MICCLLFCVVFDQSCFEQFRICYLCRMCEVEVGECIGEFFECFEVEFESVDFFVQLYFVVFNGVVLFVGWLCFQLEIDFYVIFIDDYGVVKDVLYVLIEGFFCLFCGWN